MNSEKLESFLSDVEKKLCKKWSDKYELGSVVSRSIINLINQSPGIGWVRGDAKLENEYREKVQENIEVKVPEFVSSAVKVLEEKEKEFQNKSDVWNKRGSIAIILAVVASIITLVYTSIEFHFANKSEIKWHFFVFMFLKGLIIISILGAWAKYSFNVAKAYMHESLKRNDRIHAINFGKLYLEIYGNNVEKEEMKSIFENWNIDSSTAFMKLSSSDVNVTAVQGILSELKKIINTGAPSSLYITLGHPCPKIHSARAT